MYAVSPRIVPHGPNQLREPLVGGGDGMLAMDAHAEPPVGAKISAGGCVAPSYGQRTMMARPSLTSPTVESHRSPPMVAICVQTPFTLRNCWYGGEQLGMLTCSCRT